MKLNVVQLGFAMGIVWALMTFLAGVANLIWPTYGVSFLKLLDSIYPGYHFGSWGFGGVIVATLYAAIDGFAFGVIIAWLYNLFGKFRKE